MSAKYKAYKSMQVGFSFVLENTREKLSQEQKGTAYVKGTKFRVDLGDQSLFCDGKTLYTFSKDANEVNVSDFKPGDDINPANVFTAYQKGFKYSISTEPMANTPTQAVVDLTPEDVKKPVYKIRLTINKLTNDLISARIFEKSGTRYTYKILKMDANKVMADNTFVFDKKKYPGVSVTDLR